MNDVEERILSYPHLPVEEQREIEEYVESNPEWASLLHDVRSLEQLSADVRADLPSDALLATYVVAQHLPSSEVPPRLQAVFSALETRLEEDEELRQKVEVAQRRLEKAETAVDPVAHFEALTGHRLDAEAAETDRDENPDPDAPPAERESIASVLEVFLNLPRLVQRGAVVAVLLIGVYGGLYGISRATQSTLDRLAAVEVSSQLVESYATANLRSPVPESDTLSVDDQYLKGLAALRNARVSTLGLFPRYDTEKLSRAEKHLTQVLGQVEPRSFLALEAHFYLGKIALAQKDIEDARRHFKTVVRGEGRRAEKAYEILKTLQQEYRREGDG